VSETAGRASQPVGREVETTVHGHFLERTPAGPGPWPLLVGFHGYGQTAAELLPELEQIPGAERFLVVAAQALHPFYRSRTGEVAASWMTRFNRELAIADNIRYVTALMDDLERRHPVGRPIVFLGFSQGVAMAYRAAAFSGHPASGLVALAADVPPDVAAADLTDFPRVLLARGDADSGYSAQQMEKDLATLAAKGVTAEPFVFHGGHELTPELRARIGELLASLGG
jgi:predicted esterase